MSLNLLYTFLSSAQKSQSNKILTQDTLNKFIFLDKTVKYITGISNLGYFTIPRGLPTNESSITPFVNNNSNRTVTDYTNSSVRVSELYINTSTDYPTNFTEYNINTIGNVILSNPSIHLGSGIDAKNIKILNINFKGTPTDQFAEKVVQTSNITNGSSVYINAVNPSTQVVTNLGIKKIADRFTQLNFHVQKFGTSKKYDSIIGGVYTVGTPTNKSRLYGDLGITFSTELLDLTLHSTETYGFSFNYGSTSKLTHANSITSELIKGTDSTLATNSVGSNKGIIVWFSKNQSTINGIIGLIPDGSNINMVETGQSANTITITVGKEYFAKGKITQEYYNANKDHLYLFYSGVQHSNHTYDANDDRWYSLEQVFTITAPAFKEHD